MKSCRVVQKNLVFVIGLSPRLADPEVLKKTEYFGKFGKIYKVVINNHTVYNGAQVSKNIATECSLVSMCFATSRIGSQCERVCHVRQK